jgi:hypothetical protein
MVALHRKIGGFEHIGQRNNLGQKRRLMSNVDNAISDADFATTTSTIQKIFFGLDFLIV